jgi:hypothetical protein
MNEETRKVHARDISNEGGNLAIGNNNQQIISGESPSAREIRLMVDQIRRELTRMDLPGRPAAEEALDEIGEVLDDGPVPSGPQRMDRAGRKLIRTLGGVPRFATPLAQLAAAIADLLRAKP